MLHAKRLANSCSGPIGGVSAAVQFHEFIKQLKQNEPQQCPHNRSFPANHTDNEKHPSPSTIPVAKTRSHQLIFELSSSLTNV